jgi:universal stress protein F
MVSVFRKAKGTKMYKNILIPVSMNHARDIQTAFRAAKALATDDALFTLIHVIDIPAVYTSDLLPTGMLDSTRDQAKSELSSLAIGLPNARIVIVDGRAGPAILQCAKNIKSDCIVLASHEPVFSDYLLGSTAHHVVRHAKCSVHVVR